jgi:hypothetical protein
MNALNVLLNNKTTTIMHANYIHSERLRPLLPNVGLNSNKTLRLDKFFEIVDETSDSSEMLSGFDEVKTNRFNLQKIGS